MKNKKIIAVATASVLSVNMLPLNIIKSYADEISTEQQVEEVQIPEIISLDQSVYATAVRTLMAKIKVKNSEYGTVTNLNYNTYLIEGENLISLKTAYDNYKSSGTILKTYTGTIAEQEEKVNIDIKSKSGYKATLVPNIITSGQKYLSYDTQNLITSNTQISVNPINTEKWGPGSKTDELTDDLNTEMTIDFSAKSDAQKITTEIIGNGSIIAPEELYYNNNEALIDKNSTHTFKINPGPNQQINATLDGNPLEISEENTVTIGKGHLKVEFTEEVETDKYDLNLNIGENGKINIENIDLTGQQTIKVSKEYETKLKVKPDDGYYTSEVILDGKNISPNEDGSYTLPLTDLESRNLEVNFAEKMEATIKIGNLRVPYTGEEQELAYTVIGQDEEVIYTGKAVFTKKNALQQTIYYKPIEIGNHNFIATFEGNEKYKSTKLEGTLEIYDNRKEVTIELSETTKVYNGEVQTFVANVVNEDGEIVSTVDATYDFKAEHLLNPAGKDVGTYDVTAKFGGDKDYKSSELKLAVEITKCKPTVKVENKTTTYTGEPIKSNVVVTPKCGYIGLYTGINTKLTPIVYMDVNLGDDYISKKISDFINSSEIGTVEELKALFENEVLIKLLELGSIDISGVKNALNYLPDDMALSFGAPVNAGAYVSTAVVLDQNAEVTVGIGSLIINKVKRNIVFTQESLQSGSTLKPGQDYIMEAVIGGTDEKVEIKYTGLTSIGKVYSSIEAPKTAGVYVATAYIEGESNYSADVAVRRFTISKSTSNIEIVSETNKVYDGNVYEVKVVVKDRDGEIIENANVKYTYYKGLRKLSSAPSTVGSYRVIATYSGDDAHYGSTTSMKFNITK